MNKLASIYAADTQGRDAAQLDYCSWLAAEAGRDLAKFADAESDAPRSENLAGIRARSDYQPDPNQIQEEQKEDIKPRGRVEFPRTKVAGQLVPWAELEKDANVFHAMKGLGILAARPVGRALSSGAQATRGLLRGAAQGTSDFLKGQVAASPVVNRVLRPAGEAIQQAGRGVASGYRKLETLGGAGQVSPAKPVTPNPSAPPNYLHALAANRPASNLSGFAVTPKQVASGVTQSPKPQVLKIRRRGGASGTPATTASPQTSSAAPVSAQPDPWSDPGSEYSSPGHLQQAPKSTPTTPTNGTPAAPGYAGIGHLLPAALTAAPMVVSLANRGVQAARSFGRPSSTGALPYGRTALAGFEKESGAREALQAFRKGFSLKIKPKTPGKVLPPTKATPVQAVEKVETPGKVVPKTEAAPKSAVKENPAKGVGWGHLLPYAGLAAGAYTLYKGVPWALRQMEFSNSPMAYGGGWSPTPYGYGYSAYGPGQPTMGPGA